MEEIPAIFGIAMGSKHLRILDDIVIVLGTQEEIQQRWVDQKLSEKKRRVKNQKALKLQGNATEARDINRGKRKHKGRGSRTEGGTVLQEKNTEAI